MKSLPRLLLGAVCACLFFALGASAQQDTPTPAQQEEIARAAAAHPQEPGDRRAPERDDPGLRLEWQRIIHGIPTQDFKQQLFRLRAERGAKERAAALAQQGFSPDPTVTPAGGPQWVPIGPTGADYEQNGITLAMRDSGRARTILPHPNDADTLYFLTSGGGLWVSHNFTNTNTTWTPLTDTLTTTGGGSVAFGRGAASATPGNTILYLGTGDPFDIINIGGQMYKSVNGGASWTGPVDLLNAFSVRDVKVDTSVAPDTTKDIVLVATDVGLFSSTDGGGTYNQIPLGGVTGLSVWSIIQTSAGWLANAQLCGGKILATACGTSSTIYFSTDHGANWSPINNTGTVFTAAGRTTLAVGAPGDAIVYAFAENAASTAQLDLFRSNDGGQTWIALGVNSSKTPANPNTNNPDLNLMHGQSFYNQMILVDHTDATRNTVYLGGDLSTAKTTNASAGLPGPPTSTWNLTTNWLAQFGLPYSHADNHAAAFFIGPPGFTHYVLFGNDGGLFFSPDNGVSFSSDKNNGLQTFLFYALSSSPALPGSVVAGAQDNGTRVRSGNSTIYNQTIGGDGIATGASQANSNLFVGTVQGNAMLHDLDNESPDAAAIWERLSPTIPAGDAANFLSPVGIPPAVADPSGLVFYTYSQKSVFQTVDGGLTWTTIGLVGGATNIITLPPGLVLRGKPRGLGISPLDLNRLAVIGGSGNLVISTDGGANWNTFGLNGLIPGGFASLTNVAWADNNTIYVTSETPITGVARVVKGTFSGAWSFARADAGLPDVQTNVVVVDPRDAAKNTLYVASDLGVFRSTDAGASWAAWGTGLPNVRVNDLYAPPDGSYLLAATYGRGVWELPALSFVSAALDDSVDSCDSDGVLDNGERGNLTVTLKNDGGATLNAITGTVTSLNPNVSFTTGNAITFSPAAAGGTSTGTVVVALAGAVGIAQADFAISFADASFGLTSANSPTAHVILRANYDEKPTTSASDDFEAKNTLWTVAGTPESKPLSFNWKRVEVSPTDHRWLAVTSENPTDQTLTSPQLMVGSGAFSFTFTHRYRFEFSGTTFGDGGVIEISTDGGASWNDVNLAVPGSLAPAYTGPLATGGGNPIEGRQAFAGRSPGYPALQTETVSLGTTFAGQTNVRIRFRVGTDVGTGNPGWMINDISFSGLTNKPFPSLVAQSGTCSAATTVTLTSNPNPSTIGQSVTFTATVAGGATPTGTVTFKDGTLVLPPSPVSLAAGVATLTTSALALGTHPITADYSGDGSHPATTSNTLNQVVNKIATTTVVISGQNPSNGGQAVAFTATVTGPPTPTGTVTFFDGSTSLGTISLAAGTAAFTTSTLTIGTHSITASYSGDATHATSTSAAVSQVVNGIATTTTLLSSVNPSIALQPVALTATVTGLPTPTGTVTFFDGTTSLGSGGLTTGSVTLLVSTFTTGTHSITATYNGDPTHSTSTSFALSQAVNGIATTTALISSVNPSVSGQSVSFTATVTGTAIGTVNFLDGTTTIGTASLTSGVAVFSTNTLAVGAHAITASYPGDTAHLASVSVAVTQTVNKSNTTTALTSSLNPAAFGQSVTLTATVAAAAPGSGTPSGTVTFSDGTTSLGTGTLNSSGVATLATATLTGGSHSITAAYPASTSFNASTSSALNQTIQDFTLSATGSNTVTVSAGSPASYTVAIAAVSGFTSSINFTCSLTAPATTCAPTPAAQTPGNSVTVNVTTTSRALFLPPGNSRPIGPWLRVIPVLALSMVLLTLMVGFARARKVKVRFAYVLPVAVLILFVALQTGCGGGNTPPAPHGTTAGTYTVTVTGTSGATSHPINLTLIVN